MLPHALSIVVIADRWTPEQIRGDEGWD